jgi:hypothetical protein
MTRDQWKAEIVERTFANNWPSDRLTKALLVDGPCEFCGQLMAPVQREGLRGMAQCHYATCVCLAKRATWIGGQLIPQCKKCRGLLEVRPIEKPDGTSYMRFSCACGYWVTRE